MKKYSLNMVEVETNHLIHSTDIVYLRNQRKKKFQILEDTGKYEANHSQLYLHSLNKRRLLKQWEKWRTQVKVAPHLPRIIELIIYENTFDDLEKLIIQSHQEDHSSSITSQSTLEWFSNMKHLAESLHRELDACYWQELDQYLQTCLQLDVVSNKLTLSPKDH